MMQRNGWGLLAHPVLFGQLDRLIDAAGRARDAQPDTWQTNANVRLLANLRALMFDRVPADPLHPQYRLGNTLGPAHRHWFRAKFAGNRFRLFFRADGRARIIVFAWVNDRDTLRKAGAASDPYAVFSRMLASGYPPGDWDSLLEEAKDVLL